MKVELKKISQHSLLMQWEKVELDQINAARKFLHHEFDGILEAVPAFKELAIYLHFGVKIDEFCAQLKKKLPELSTSESLENSKIYHIPVCYNDEFGLDLQALAKENGLGTDEVIKLHTEPQYRIHFLGFLPGFPYLSGLNPKLHRARLENPRTKISAGSVGIAGDQTGIYPQDSPGGWNIIGRSPIQLFNIKKDPPALLEAGQKLKFYPIELEEFQSIEELVAAGKYKLEVTND